MAPDNELTRFTQGAASAFGFGDVPGEPEPDEDDLEPVDAQADGDDEEDDDTEAEGELSHEELFAAFEEQLTDFERDAIERSDEVRDRLWAKFVTGQGYELEDDGDEDAEGSAYANPASGLAVIQMVYADPEGLEDAEGTPVDPAEWVARWVDASPEEWVKACREAGWPTNTPQPSHADLRLLGRGVRGQVLSASWSEHMAKARAAGRLFGQ